MGTPPVVFDISSDEESGPDEIGGVEDFGGTGAKAADDDDWLLKLLEVADVRADDDSDEVVLVAEYNSTKKIPKSKSSNPTVKFVVDDDDCVILDSDPDSSMATVNDPADGSDELLIVAEKGQIACRDYPHSRHLCARFPFSSTSHEKHCDLCHCYVCDTVAPCPYWGVGISPVDHCHATDKVENWKMQRKSFRRENHNPANQSLPHLAIRSTSNSAPGSCISTFNDSLPKYQIFQSGNISASSIGNNEAHRQSAPAESRFQLQSVPHSHLGVHHSSSRVIRKSIRRDRGTQMSCLTSRFVTSDVMFKRTAALGAAAQANQFPPYRAINPPPVVAPLQPAGDPIGWQDSPASVISESSGGMVCPSLVEIGNQTAHQPVNPIQGADEYPFQPGIQVQDAADPPQNLNFDWLTDNSLNNRPTPEDPNWLYDLNILSPPPTSIDEGMLGFYFETS